jgi:hypothetical protein
MSLDFLLKAVDRDSFEALATEHGFLDEDGNPVPGADFDPTPGSPAYEAGIPVAPPEELQGEWVPGFHFNLRVSGELAAEQIEGIPQTDPKDGSLLPLRLRTRFGITMTELGTEWVGENGTTTGVTYAGVTFIDPESIASPQRVWL